MGKPLIGISCYREEADWGSWAGVRADLMPAAYANAVAAAGGLPVLLPPIPDSGDGTADAATVVGRIDGLIMGGGADIEPARYGAEPGPHTESWRGDRDAWELALLAAARERAVPTLGICRGMQLMAVAAGGALDQHVPDAVGHQGHSPAPGVYGRTSVEIAPASQLGGILGERLTVPCSHHQYVADHPTFAPVARAADGLLEAMENPDLPFWLAVQWHPETDSDPRLFGALIAATQA